MKEGSHSASDPSCGPDSRGRSTQDDYQRPGHSPTALLARALPPPPGKWQGTAHSQLREDVGGPVRGLGGLVDRVDGGGKGGALSQGSRCLCGDLAAVDLKDEQLVAV